MKGGTITLLGLAKGAAMIGPNMATMLGFLLTDARVEPETLRAPPQKMRSTDSFNCISVEGHMSTNDTVLALANGASGVEDDEAVLTEMIQRSLHHPGQDDPRRRRRSHAPDHHRRGRGEDSSTRPDCHRPKAVADSPLVKTAIHGADPNWGRIVSAAGYAGVPFEEADLSLWLNGIPLYHAGAPLPFDDASASSNLRDHRETHIRLALDHGDATVRFWTCDLTAEYVRLNADYTT